MKIYRFDHQVGSAIEDYDSQNVILSGVVKIDGGAAVSRIRIEPGGVLGYHPAANQQLFMVVAGRGWVRAEKAAPVPITAGQAALWAKGEQHESGSQQGMTAIVVEGVELQPEAYMPLVHGLGE